MRPQLSDSTRAAVQHSPAAAASSAGGANPTPQWSCGVLIKLVTRLWRVVGPWCATRVTADMYDTATTAVPTRPLGPRAGAQGAHRRWAPTVGLPSHLLSRSRGFAHGYGPWSGGLGSGARQLTRSCRTHGRRSPPRTAAAGRGNDAGTIGAHHGGSGAKNAENGEGRRAGNVLCDSDSRSGHSRACADLSPRA